MDAANVRVPLPFWSRDAEEMVPPRVTAPLAVFTKAPPPSERALDTIKTPEPVLVKEEPEILPAPEKVMVPEPLFTKIVPAVTALVTLISAAFVKVTLSPVAKYWSPFVESFQTRLFVAVFQVPVLVFQVRLSAPTPVTTTASELAELVKV